MTQPFAARWAEKERALGFEAIAATMIRVGTEVLPSSAAPCVDFQLAANPRHVWELFGSAADWSEADKARLSGLLVIGSDGAGNPVCIDTKSKGVLLLDHERRFEANQFVNSSIQQLAECLLAYMGEESAIAFKSAVLAIDPEALRHGAFWWHAANDL